MTRADSCRVGAVVLALVATVLVAAGVGEPVKAAFPGHNGKIIFASSRSTGPGVDNPSGDYEIFSMNPDGTGLTQLTNNGFGVDDFAPAFSADGAKITYSSSGAQTSNPEGDPEIYVMAADGSNLTNLTNNNGSAPVTDPDWQPSNSSSPAATDDSYTTNENQLLNEAASGVLSNDTDADGDSLSVVGSSLGTPAHGKVELITTSGTDKGKVLYTPRADYNGPDSFKYRASDGSAQSNVATVNFTVGAVNDAPVAQDDSYNVNENTQLQVSTPGVVGNDSDADGDSLTAVQVTGPANGQLTLNTNGSFTYTPDANFSGTDSFTYKANDGSADSNTATVTITVNHVDTTAPTVVSVEPPDKLTITFSEKMDPSALNAKTVTLVKPGKKPTSIPVTMTNKTGSSGRTVLTLDPYGATTQKLAGNTTYQLTIEGAGDTDGLAVRDSVGNELAKDYVSSFTTARK